MLSIRIKENEKSKGREGETRVRFARLRDRTRRTSMEKKRRESHVCVIDDAEKKCLIFLIVQ